MEEITNQINSIKNQIGEIQSNLKLLEKSIKRKLNDKLSKKSKKVSERKLSGFAIPSEISKELSVFLNKSEGTYVARTDVTKEIIEYIKMNNLQKKSDKKVIEPDDKLKNLLGITENDVLTYFTLQKYMNKHFIKSEV
jgi:chromatin remodeling complex protein RSC6